MGDHYVIRTGLAEYEDKCSNGNSRTVQTQKKPMGTICEVANFQTFVVIYFTNLFYFVFRFSTLHAFLWGTLRVVNRWHRRGSSREVSPPLPRRLCFTKEDLYDNHIEH